LTRHFLRHFGEKVPWPAWEILCPKLGNIFDTFWISLCSFGKVFWIVQTCSFQPMQIARKSIRNTLKFDNEMCANISLILYWNER
jgi:hypothetical protein